MTFLVLKKEEEEKSVFRHSKNVLTLQVDFGKSVKTRFFFSLKTFPYINLKIL